MSAKSSQIPDRKGSTQDTSFRSPVTGNRKNKVFKMLPTQVRQTKEDLYELALQSKIEANDLREDNRRL